MNAFQNLHQPTKRILTIEEKDYLFFGGTAYLGLLDNPQYIALFKKGIDKYGLNNGTSRSNNVQLGIYNDAEEKLALRFGFEASALFSSGYLAAQATVRALTDGSEVIYAPASHPALWMDGNPQVEESFEQWALRTINYINDAKRQKFVIVSNCIDNLRPENYDFSVFDAVSSEREVLFILDDSHGLAVVNKNDVSSNIGALKARPNFEIVIISSLAKGLGTDAGLVLGDLNNLMKIKEHPIFMGASPASPAAIYALVNSEAIYDAAFERMHANIDYFSSHLPADSGLSHIPNFPVFSSNNPDLYSHLVNNNILISSFPYPLASSPLLNRIVISALHSKGDLDCLLDIYGFKCK